MSAPQQRADIAGHGAEPSLRLSLPRSVRLCESTAYERVFAAPSRSTDHYFTVLSRERSSRDRVPTAGARLGLAISKRCAQRAVVRNRIKRVVRESFRLTRERLPAIDLVVLCRHAAAKADTATLRASLATHWMRFHP